jgi:hypothetical protein
MKSDAWRRATLFAAALVIAIVGAAFAYDSAMNGAGVAVGVLR